MEADESHRQKISNQDIWDFVTQKPICSGVSVSPEQESKSFQFHGSHASNSSQMGWVDVTAIKISARVSELLCPWSFYYQCTVIKETPLHMKSRPGWLEALWRNTNCKCSCSYLDSRTLKDSGYCLLLCKIKIVFPSCLKKQIFVWHQQWISEVNDTQHQGGVSQTCLCKSWGWLLVTEQRN